MDNQPDLEFADLREKFLKERVYKFLPLLQTIEDANWNKPIRMPLGGTVFEFRKFNHGEVALLGGLPYFGHLNKLDESEAKDFQIVKRMMVERIATEPNRWLELTKDNPDWVDIVFSTILGASTLDVKRLDEFFETDMGRAYGTIWFLHFHMTPTEVGQMSEPSYQAVLSFFRKNSERFQNK